MLQLQLNKRANSRGHVENIKGGWRFSLDKGKSGIYRLAQVDDYNQLGRRNFPHRPPFRLDLHARASQTSSPGTWGFGLWNDPSPSVYFGIAKARLPVLPNAAWFFFASPENHLSLRNNLRGNGAMAAIYRSPSLPALLLSPALLIAPFLALPFISRWLRTMAAKVIRHEIVSLGLKPKEWNHFTLQWKSDEILFKVNDQRVLRSHLVPRSPLGLVLWLDNQYAAWRPDGHLSFGTLPTPADCWVEIKDLQIS